MASHGLNLSLGVGHMGAENPMNLVDDFIEPFRPIVDCKVASIAATWNDQAPKFKGEEKKKLLAVMSAVVRSENQDWRLPAAVGQTVESYLRVLDERSSVLALPTRFSLI